VFSSLFPATATTDLYTLSLHDALPILTDHESLARTIQAAAFTCRLRPFLQAVHQICFGSPKCRSKTENDCRSYRYENSESEYSRSEEHTSELQSPCNLVCRLLLEKKKK